MLCLVLFFFFKQKTAYEIGTGDWSSDVCSSDLIRGGTPLSGAATRNDYIARSAAQGLSGMRSVADTYLDHMYLKPSWIRNYN